MCTIGDRNRIMWTNVVLYAIFFLWLTTSLRLATLFFDFHKNLRFKKLNDLTVFNSLKRCFFNYHNKSSLQSCPSNIKNVWNQSILWLPLLFCKSKWALCVLPWSQCIKAKPRKSHLICRFSLSWDYSMILKFLFVLYILLSQRAIFHPKEKFVGSPTSYKSLKILSR